MIAADVWTSYQLNQTDSLKLAKLGTCYEPETGKQTRYQRQVVRQTRIVQRARRCHLSER